MADVTLMAESKLESERRKTLRELRTVAAGVLAGQIDPLDGASQIARLRHDSGLPLRIFDVFVGVDSEADEFPLPHTRHLWAESRLRELDDARRAYTERVRAVMVEACTTLVAECAALPDQGD
jgi:hypothetical protein